MNLDGITKKRQWSRLIDHKLSDLKKTSQVPWRRKNLAIFVAAGALLLGTVFGSSFIQQSRQETRQILGTATAALGYLEEGRLEDALLTFEKAGQEIGGLNDELKTLLNLWPAGLSADSVEEATAELLTALQSVKAAAEQFANLRLNWDPEANATDQSFYQGLKQTREMLWDSVRHLERVEDILAGVNTTLLPPAFGQRLSEAHARLQKANNGLKEAVALQGFILNLLGGPKKTYLLVFQNNDELRPTGGFIGTYGLLEFENGHMRLLRIETIYNLDGQLRELIVPPWPMQANLTDHWALRDSNWFFDFPASASKMLDFLQKEAGLEAQGVAAFTPDVFERLLTFTGPIAMPEYDAVLSAENFRETVQYKTSVEYDRVLNQPKQLLEDFAPRFLGRLSALPLQNQFAVFAALSTLAREKHLQIFSKDGPLQTQIASFGLDGGVKKTPGDYLAIVHSNLGGGKTDQNISQNVEKKVTIFSGSLALTTLKITRTNLDFAESFFPQNQDFIRVFVPAAARLLSASGFEDMPRPPADPAAVSDLDVRAWEENFVKDERFGIYVGEESGYTVFANWMKLAPGETKTLELIYEMPTPSPQAYTLLVQKQAGEPPYEFFLSLNYLPGSIVHAYPGHLAVRQGEAFVAEKVGTDKFYGIVGQ